MSVKLAQDEIIPAKGDVGALGNRINLETRSLHDTIDKLVTLKFAIAVRDPKVYRQGLQMFYHVFSAIEESLEREMNADTKYSAMLREIWRPALARRAPLHQDLMFFYKDQEQKFADPVLKQQIDAIEHIREVTKEKPYLLLAYMHVLYLALFAGGRIMSSQVTKSLRLFPQVPGKSFEDVVALGTNFFKFEVDDPMVLRQLYKRDYELQTRNFLTEAEKLEIIEESKGAFTMTTDGIREIERHNLQILRAKLSYQLVTKSYTISLALVMLLVIFLLKRLVSHLM